MNKKIMMTAVFGAAVAAGVAHADEAEELKRLRDELKMQKQEMTDLLARMESIEKDQGFTKDKMKSMDWAERIKIKGDIRYRYEWREKEDNAGDNMATDKSRQRIRARLGVFGEVNDEMDFGVQLATGEDKGTYSEANSANQTIGDSFNSKSIWLDLAYIDYHPDAVPGLNVLMGKMKQPWKNVSDLMWDSDVNPEGLAAKYSRDLDGVTLFSTLGALKVVDTSDTHDLNLYAAQLGATAEVAEGMKLTVGGSYYDYDNVEDFFAAVVTGSGNDTAELDGFEIYEGFAEFGVKDVLPVPFKLYSNYIVNNDADREDSGYCAGIKFNDAKKGKWEVKFDYRDLEANAAPDYYVDSDFAGGGTGVKGPRVKAKYNLGKNWQFGAAYIMGTRTDERTGNDDADVNTLQLDLVAKF